LPRRLRAAAGVAQTSAITVSSIEAGSPADRGGLQAGDIILAIDGATVTAADDLVRNLTADKIGRSVTLAIFRSGERRTVSLSAEERPRKGRGSSD
jgi:serine protease Do